MVHAIVYMLAQGVYVARCNTVLLYVLYVYVTYDKAHIMVYVHDAYFLL